MDFNKNQTINKEDVKIVSEQFHSINNSRDLPTVSQIIEDFFGNDKLLCFNKYKDKIYHLNFDLFFLIYSYIIHHQPFDNNSLNYFEKEIVKKDEDIDIKDDINHLKELAIPSENLYLYLMNQFIEYQFYCLQ